MCNWDRLRENVFLVGVEVGDVGEVELPAACKSGMAKIVWGAEGDGGQGWDGRFKGDDSELTLEIVRDCWNRVVAIYGDAGAFAGEVRSVEEGFPTVVQFFER